MQPSTRSTSSYPEFEAWGRDDADAWREAEQQTGLEAWVDDDVLLDSDLWMDNDFAGELSEPSLRRLGIG